jgi:membrane protease YdiL (CAAX protease family)
VIEIGIGPVIRVLRHLSERQRLYPLKFASGERALVLITGMPAPSVELVRVVLGGLIPWQTVWEYNPKRAGGYSDYIHKLKAMFSPTTERIDDSLPDIRDALVRCPSIKEARVLLLERERVANNSPTESGGFPRQNPSSVESWELGIRSFPSPSSTQIGRMSVVPDRYRVRNDAKGRFLMCLEAPTATVRVQRGRAISAKQAHRFPAGAIFLGGAVQGTPFVNVQKDVYNLDHQQGCIRSLATCEQAMVLIRKIRDLRMRDWVVWAKDTSLDTVLAIWVVLNHLRLNEDAEIRAKVMPLLRLEGVIDAHGPDLEDLAALTPDLLRSTSATLKQLRRQETLLKYDGTFSEANVLEYIADRLRVVDKLIYSPDGFAGLHQVDELARGEIANGSVAVVCRSEAGMVDVERQLQRNYGQRLGILIFDNPPSAYRLKRVDRTLPATLESAYERLNLVDPAVKGGSQNRWRGSAEIGASPRGTETRLTPGRIIEAVQEAFRKPTIIDIISELPGAVSLAVAALLPAMAAVFAGNLLRDRGYLRGETLLFPAVALTITVGMLFWLKVRRVPGLYGWRAPTGFGWLAVFPAALVAAAIGGVWAPGSLGYPIGPGNLYEFTASAVFLFSLGAELLFRGVILGHLASRLPLRTSAGPWWSSWPTLISSAVYAAMSLLLFLSFSGGQLQLSQWVALVAGGLTFGIASGIARERSESIIPSVLLHWVCAATLLLAGRFVF